MWLKGNFGFSFSIRICDGFFGRPQDLAANIAKYKLFEDPTNVELEAICADLLNRSTPNIGVCHQVLAESSKKDGHDPSKPQCGLCRSFAVNEELREKLLAWSPTAAIRVVLTRKRW